MFQFRNIRSRLTFWFFILSLVPMIVANTIIYEHMKQSRKEAILAKLEAIRDLKVEEVNHWLDERTGDVRTIAADPQVLELEKIYQNKSDNPDKNNSIVTAARDHLSEYLRSYGYFYEIHIMDPRDKKILICTDKRHEGDRRQDDTGDITYSDIFKEGRSYVRDVYYSERERRPSMAFYVPVYSQTKSGHIFGILTAVINLDTTLYPLLLHRTGMGETGEALIVNRDALALSELRWYENAPLNLKIRAVPAIEASRGNKGIIETEDYRGEMVLAAYTYIPKAGWGFVAKQDLKEVYKTIYELRNWTISIGIVTICIVVIAAFRISKSISEPIKALHKGSEIIGRGNLDHKVGTDVQDEIGRLSRSFDEMTIQLKKSRTALEDEISERRAAEERLRQEKEKLKKYLDISAVIVIMIDADQKVTLINKKGCELLGYREEEIIGKNWFDHFLPERVRDEIKQVHTELMAGKIEPLEYYENEVLTREGEERSIAWYNTVFRDERGRITQTLGSGVDITERKKSEELIRKSLREKDVLVKEIHHRVKNNMAVISSLLKLQANKIDEKKYSDMFHDSMGRIKSMALLHEKLYRSEDLSRLDFSAYLKEVVRAVFTSYRMVPGRISLKMDIENVDIGIDTAIPCGLIVNELVSNSLKHAFPGDRNGELTVSLHMNDENGVELSVADNGVGMSGNMDLGKTTSLGLNLVNTLVRQLQGKMEVNRKQGTEFKITFQEA